MSRFLLALLIAVSAAKAQNALWVDLSGPWLGTVGDRPEFSSPHLDDSAWSQVKLAGSPYSRATSNLNDSGWSQVKMSGRVDGQATFWMRRHATLPEGTDLNRLAITLGARQQVYELYLNGTRIGASGSIDSFEDSGIPRPRTFVIPPGVVRGKDLLIALRLRSGFFMSPGWRVPDTGPYRITYADHAPVEAGTQAIVRQWMAQSPILMFASAFSVIGLLAWLAWRMDPSRRELLWFAGVAAQRVLTALVEMALLSEQSHPFSSNGVASWQLLVDTFEYPLFGQFVLAALGIRNRWLVWLLWAGWIVEPLMLLPGANYRIGTFIGNIWANAFVVGIIIWDWRRVSRTRAGFEPHVLRASMLLFPLYWAAFWIAQAIRPFRVVSMTFGVHELEFRHSDIAWLVLSATLMTLLLRRLVTDRREAQRLSGELRAARTIQDLLISKSSPGTPGLPVEAAYHPAFEVGGDFFQVVPTQDGGLLIAVGDVSGKGLRAAMVVSLLTGALRNRKANRPGALLCELNHVLAEEMEGGFVTATIAHCTADGRVTLASAGNLAPYLDRQEVTLHPGLPLGIDLSAEYAEFELILDVGQQLTFVSDGVVEAANADGELFGFERTREISGNNPSEIAAAARAWGQNDDITAVTVRRSL